MIRSSDGHATKQKPATKTKATSISRTKRPKSPLTYIHRLPVEILLDIFDFALAPFDIYYYYTYLYELIIVCKGWANIIYDTPRYWFYVGFGHTPPLRVVLDRAKSQPLRIDHHHVGKKKENDEALFGRMEQWRSITLHLVAKDAAAGLDYQERLWTDPAPLVEKITLWGKWDDEHLPFPDLFGGQAPKLRSLKRDRCWIDLDSPIFKQLRLLDLSDIFLPDVSFADFGNFLETCENLTYLELHMVGVDVDIPDRPEPVTLPKLTTLHMHEVDAWETFDILDMLNMPRCKEIKVTYSGTDDSMGELEVPHNDMCPLIIPAIKRILGSSDHITVVLKYEDDCPIIKISAVSGERKVFEFRVGKVETPAACFARVVEDWGFRDMDVPIVASITWPDDNGEEEEDVEVLGDTLRNMPSMTKLILPNCKSAPIVHALDVLSDPMVTEESLQWPCPNLQALLVTYSEEEFSGLDVLSMVKHRYGDDYRIPDGVARGSLPLQRPKPFEDLVFQGVEDDEELQDMVKEALGEDSDLIWDPNSESYLSEFEMSKSSDDEWDGRTESELDKWGDDE